MRMFKSIFKDLPYQKIKLPSWNSEIYLICWNENSRSIIHNHNGKNCNFIIFNGKLNEYIYENKNINSMKHYNLLKPFQLNFINDDIGYHQIMNMNNKKIWSLHRYL